ncbi:MAG: outer membrane protein assembly factor BamE, partial [Oscillospiraceae bacterium]|nr:outer membrane protein assembly factor BamE [Oscillospiraceae bacterium]
MNIYEKLSPVAKLSKEEIKMKAQKSPEYKPQRQIAYKAISFATAALVLAGTGFGIHKFALNNDKESLAPGYSATQSGNGLVNVEYSNPNGNIVYTDFETTCWDFTDGIGDIEFHPDYYICESYEDYLEYMTTLIGQIHPDDKEMQEWLLDFAKEITLAGKKEFEDNVLCLFLKDTYDTSYNFQSLVVGDENYFCFNARKSDIPIAQNENGEDETRLSIVQIPKEFYEENFPYEKQILVRYLHADENMSYDRIVPGTTRERVIEIMGTPALPFTEESYTYVLANGDTVTYNFDENNIVTDFVFNGMEEPTEKPEIIPYEESLAAQIELGMTEEEVSEIFGRDTNAENFGADRHNVTLSAYSYFDDTNLTDVVFDKTGVVGVKYNDELVLGEIPKRMMRIVDAEYDVNAYPPPYENEDPAHFLIDYAGLSDYIGQGEAYGTPNPYIIFHQDTLGMLFIFEMYDNTTGKGEIIKAVDLKATIGDFPMYYIDVNEDGTALTIATEPDAEYKDYWNLSDLKENDSPNVIQKKVELDNVWEGIEIPEDYEFLDALPTLWGEEADVAMYDY